MGPKPTSRDSTDHVLSDSLRRNSTTSEAWRDGVAQASTPLEQTMEDQGGDDEEVFMPDNRRQKRKPTEAGTKPNWTPKRRVCEQCLKDQIFSDSEAPESEATEDDDDDADENPWIDVRRRRKANIDWSTRDISCKRGHFQGRKHPLTTTADDTIAVPTRKTRSQCPVTSENLMPPARPLEYKTYSKRK